LRRKRKTADHVAVDTMLLRSFIRHKTRDTLEWCTLGFMLCMILPWC